MHADNETNWNRIKNLSCVEFENGLAKMASLNKTIRTLGMCRIRCHKVFGNTDDGKYATTEKAACWKMCTGCY